MKKDRGGVEWEWKAGRREMEGSAAVFKIKTPIFCVLLVFMQNYKNVIALFSSFFFPLLLATSQYKGAKTLYIKSKFSSPIII